MSESTEFSSKRTQIGQWLEARRADAVLLANPANVHWFGLGCELGRAESYSHGFVVTHERAWLLCPREDVDRARQEEVRGLDLEIVPLPDASGPEVLVERARGLVAASARWRCDVPGLMLEYDSSVEALRQRLLPEEIERLRKLGRDAASAIEDVAAECYGGIVETDAAARLAAECMRRSITPRAILAGADERVETYARPYPKRGHAERLLRLGLVARRGGLHVTLSRLICMTRPHDKLIERYGEALDVVARLCHAARAGEMLGAVAQQIPPEPREGAFTHGSVIGYAFPEIEVRPTSHWRLAAGQPLAWTVNAPGVRCEDTFVLTDTGSELLTTTHGWPRRTVHYEGRVYELPDMMQL